MTVLPVSVAIAAYNGAKYIREQIDSILDQTHPVKEIIISDDNSIDNTREIIKEYAKKKYPVVLLEQYKHVGLNKNFQQAIQGCSGKLIAISDQDNIWVKDKIETMLNHLDDYDLLYSDSYLALAKDETYKKLSESKKYIFTNGDSPKEFYFYNAVFGHNILFRRELCDYFLPFPESGINYDGWIAFVASCVGKIKYLDIPLTYYRLHEDNITHRPPRRTQKRKEKEPKWLRKKKYNHKLIEKIRLFASAAQLNEEERRFINKFLEELLKLDESYFRPRLGLMMLIHNRSMLHHKNKFSGIGKSISLSLGLKYYRLFSN